MQYGFYFNQNRCTGCFTCVIACRDWNDLPAGPASWLRVKTVEKGNYPKLFTAFLPLNCYHCETPACAGACPAEAITKRKDDGIVTVNKEACLGKDRCGLCSEACPYGVPQFSAEKDAKMQKCNYCLDRLEAGKKPACVDGCPMRALDAGPLSYLKANYCNSSEAEGFQYHEGVKPAVTFKPKIDKNKLIIKKTVTVP